MALIIECDHCKRRQNTAKESFKSVNVTVNPGADKNSYLNFCDDCMNDFFFVIRNFVSSGSVV